MRIRQELLSAPRSFESWDAAVEFMRRLRPTVSEAARLDRLRNMLKQRPDGTWTWQYDHAGVDLWPHIEAIRSPTLVLRGGRSDYLARDVAQSLSVRNRIIQWREIADAGHYIHDDQPEVFTSRVLAFLTAPEKIASSP